MKRYLFLMMVLFVAACDSAHFSDNTQILEADTLKGAALLLNNDNQTAVILCHGKGKNPRGKVVEPLRKAIYQQLGFTTLSIQMPVLETDDWKSYAQTFPNAIYRIDQAIDFLKSQYGIQKIYLVGHSMGSRMVSYYASEQNNKALKGFIVTGCRNSGGPVLSCKTNLRNVSLPVLDIWGSTNDQDQQAGKERNTLVSDHYQQITIEQAPHSFEGHEDEMLKTVIHWLKKQP